jgi:hypothetical protein
VFAASVHRKILHHSVLPGVKESKAINIQAKYELSAASTRVIKKLICMAKYRTALSEHASFQCFKGGTIQLF